MVLVSHGWGRMLNLSLAETLGLTENRQMLIQCPDCAAAFEVPERLLADPSRPLRCSQCRTVFPIPESAAPKTKGWRDPEPMAPAPSPVPAPPPAAVEEPPATKAAAPQPPDEPLAARESPPEAANDDASSRRLRAAWVASVLVLILGGVGAVAQRAEIMEVWPPSARLFAALGLG
jgi:predicted Zn finger-like uncharacterized protein